MVSSSVQYCCIHNVCKPVWSAVGRCFPRCQVAAFDPHITIESMERIIKASCLCCLLFEFAWFPIEWCRAYFTVNSQSSSAVENLVTNLVGQRRPQRIGYTKQGPTPCGKNHVVAGNWARSDMERQHSSRFLEEHFSCPVRSVQSRFLTCAGGKTSETDPSGFEMLSELHLLWPWNCYQLCMFTHRPW